MRAVRSFALSLALVLPLAACVEMTGPETVVVEDRCAARRVYLPSTVDAALTGYDCLTDDATESFVDYYEGGPVSRVDGVRRLSHAVR